LSLLLDALKEAEKQRKTGGDAVQAGSESLDVDGDGEMELELELDLESTSEPDSVLSKPLSRPAGLEGSLSAEDPQAGVSDSTTADKSSSSTPHGHISSATLNKTNIESPHSANAVFRNRGRLKTKRYVLLGLVIACLSLLVIGAYLFFITDDLSPPSQKALRTVNVNQPLVHSAGESGISTEKPVTELVMTAVVPPVAESQSIEGLQHEGKAGSELSQSVMASSKETLLETESLNKPLSNTGDEKDLSGKTADDYSAEESFTGIKIRKRHIPAKREISLRRARQAMANGDLTVAELNFGSVLKVSENNVAALLGMANLSAIKGQIEQAQSYYQRVLVQSPQNLSARAGLLSLASSSSLDVGSALQQLLRERPEQAFLHASLGDYYLKRSEWPAAQAAYFDAFSRDTKNADYAYNLAISLDQMAKPKLALQFYQQALSLEKTSSAYFDKAVLVARITILKAAQR